MIQLQEPEISHAHEGFVLSLDFSPNGRQLASTEYEQKLNIWEPGGWNLTGAVHLENKGVQYLVYSADGRMIAVASDHRVKLVDTESIEVSQAIVLDPKGVYCLAFSPDGQWLACGSADKRLRIWELA